MAGQSTPATTALNRCGVSYRLHTYRVDQRAHSNGAQRVFKTLVTQLDGQLVVAVVPVSAQLDLRALAAVRGAKKAKMASAADAERATGYVTGGIVALGHRKQLPVVIDVSVQHFETVFCSAGRRGLQTRTGSRRPGASDESDRRADRLGVAFGAITPLRTHEG